MDKEFIDKIYDDILILTLDKRDFIRESFLSIFVYLPIIMKEDFKKYVKKTILKVIESISHDKEKIRNLAIKSIKI